MKKNLLVKKFGKEKRWVNYRLVKLHDKFTKIPYTIKGEPASSTNPEHWSTYDEAFKVSTDVGIVFTNEETLIGIDIDHCLTDGKIEHEAKEEIASLILEADTYTEISPSKTGLHLFLALKAPFSPVANKKSPFEIYTKGRYFTFTGNPYGEDRPVRTITQEELLKILATIGYPWGKQEKKVDHIADAGKKVDMSYDPLQKMFDSKNGAKIRKLYDGDTSDYKNDESRADMALLLHLAFWTGKNTSLMESLWLASPLGSRKKTQERKDYRDRSISAAIDECKDVYTPPPAPPEGLDLLYTYSKQKGIVYTQNTENMCRILKGHSAFQGRFRYDTFKNIVEMADLNAVSQGETVLKWRPLEDSDAIFIQTQISILFEYFQKVGKDMVYDAIIAVSKENKYDSASDWIKSLNWDGTARLDKWLSVVYGAPEDEYHIAVGSNWLKGLVKRITEPGCKFDYVLVLEGEQGVKKSTSLYVLGGDWHVETTMSTDNKDFFMQFQGKAIIEFSEGETLSRTEVKRMKAIITMQSDKYRPPYERVSKDFPRRCVFAMTTNQSEYLKDETGNRRWLPVLVTLPQANIEWLATNRDQLFAEAYHRVANKGEKIYEFPEEATKQMQADRQVADPNTDSILDWYYGVLTEQLRLEGITAAQVFQHALGNQFSKNMNKTQEMSICNILRNVLKLDKRQTMINGIRRMRWFQVGKPTPVEFSKSPDEVFNEF